MDNRERVDVLIGKFPHELRGVLMSVMLRR